VFKLNSLHNPERRRGFFDEGFFVEAGERRKSHAYASIVRNLRRRLQTGNPIQNAAIQSIERTGPGGFIGCILSADDGYISRSNGLILQRVAEAPSTCTDIVRMICGSPESSCPRRDKRIILRNDRSSPSFFGELMPSARLQSRYRRAETRA